MVNYQGDSLNEIRKKLHPAINGIAELRSFLDEILFPPKDTLSLDEKDYYRLFKLGDANSIIRIHIAKNPTHTKVWFYDLLGRPAPRVVVNTMNEFFKTMFNMEEAPFIDLYKNSFSTVFANTFKINDQLLPQDKELFAIKKLMQETVTSSALGLFHHTKETTTEPVTNDETPQKTPNN